MAKTKKSVNFTLDIAIVETLKKLSDVTLIPQARLVQKALEELFEEMADAIQEEDK